MSIKAINKIPLNKTQERKNYREKIYNDIQEAFEKHISLFEFEGDYKWTTLATAAREEARKYFNTNYFYPISKKVKEELQIELNERYIYISSIGTYDKRAISITSQKKEDRTHIYCEIHFDLVDNLYTVMKDETREHYLEIIARRQRNG